MEDLRAPLPFLMKIAAACPRTLPPVAIFFHTFTAAGTEELCASVSTVNSRLQSVTPLNPVDLPAGAMLITCSCELARAGEWRYS